MTTPTPYATPHLDSVPAAYCHHLADNLRVNWHPFLVDGLMSIGVAGAMTWFAYHHLDPFWGAAMVGVVIVMIAALLRDTLAWPLYEALRSQEWYGPDRIVYRDGVGPVQVLDVDTRPELSELTWVLVRRAGERYAPGTWAPLTELAPSPEALTSGDGEVEL